MPACLYLFYGDVSNFRTLHFPSNPMERVHFRRIVLSLEFGLFFQDSLQRWFHSHLLSVEGRDAFRVRYVKLGYISLVEFDLFVCFFSCRGYAHIILQIFFKGNHSWFSNKHVNYNSYALSPSSSSSSSSSSPPLVDPQKNQKKKPSSSCLQVMLISCWWRMSSIFSWAQVAAGYPGGGVSRVALEGCVWWWKSIRWNPW